MLIVYPTYCIILEVFSPVLSGNTLDLFDPSLIDPTENNILGINKIPETKIVKHRIVLRILLSCANIHLY